VVCICRWIVSIYLCCGRQPLPAHLWTRCSRGLRPSHGPWGVGVGGRHCGWHCLIPSMSAATVRPWFDGPHRVCVCVRLSGLRMGKMPSWCLHIGCCKVGFTAPARIGQTMHVSLYRGSRAATEHVELEKQIRSAYSIWNCPTKEATKIHTIISNCAGLISSKHRTLIRGIYILESVDRYLSWYLTILRY
jgi:hypothetical protein